MDVLTSMLDSSLPLTAQEYDEWGDPRYVQERLRMIPVKGGAGVVILQSSCREGWG